MTKEINNLEKNAARVRNARKDLTSEDSLFPVPKQEKKRDAGRKEECGNSVPPNAIYAKFDIQKAKVFVAFSPPVRLSGIQEIFTCGFPNPRFWNLEFSSRTLESP